MILSYDDDDDDDGEKDQKEDLRLAERSSEIESHFSQSKLLCYFTVVVASSVRLHLLHCCLFVCLCELLEQKLWHYHTYTT